MKQKLWFSLSLSALFLLIGPSTVFSATFPFISSVDAGVQTGSVTAGTAGSVTFPVTVQGLGSGNLSLSVSGLPSGTTGYFAPTTTTVTSSGSTTWVKNAVLTLFTTSGAAATSSANFTVRASIAGTSTDSGTDIGVLKINSAGTTDPVLTYVAGTGGTLTGSTTQSLISGATSSPVTALPDSGFSFVNWSDGSTTATRIDIMGTTSATFTANFASSTASTTNTITYVAGTGGTITGSTTQALLQGATTTAVTAVPSSGFSFVSWNDGTTSATRSDTMGTTSKTFTASFTATASSTASTTLTYVAGAGGSITGTTTQSLTQNATGTPVTAVANPGFHFVNWSDGTTTATRTDVMGTTSATFTANFASNPTHTITYSVASSTMGFLIGSTTQSVPEGATSTQVIALPNPGFHFLSWSDATGTPLRSDLMGSTSLSFTATFATGTVSHTITYVAGPNGTLTGSTTQIVPEGATTTAVTASGNSGFHFLSWSDGSTTATRTDYSIGNVTFTATFATDTPATTTPSSGGTTTSTSSGGGGGGNGPIVGSGYSFNISNNSVIPGVGYTGGTTTPPPTTTPGQVQGATAYNFTKSLTVGSTGQDVTELQKLLTTLGFYSGPVTGYFGPLTKAGVIKFQTARGISPIGIVGPLTRAELNKGSGTNVPTSSSGSHLSATQVSAIISLLQSFNVDAATIANVNAILTK